MTFDITFFEKNHSTLQFNDIFFLLKILFAESNGFTKKFIDYHNLINTYYKLNDSKHTKQIFKKLLGMCHKRYLFIHSHVFEEFESIYFSDPNFHQNLVDAQSGQKEIFELFSKYQKPVFFALIRDPMQAICSLLKTQPKSLEVLNNKGVERLVRRYDQIDSIRKIVQRLYKHNLRVLLFDFNYFMKNTNSAFIKLCNFLEIKLISELSIPVNPNPSKRISRRHYEILKDFEPKISAEIEKKIDLKKYHSLVKQNSVILKVKG